MAELSPLETIFNKRLERIGASLRKEHSTGDNSYSTEYIIQYGEITVIEPTLEFALITLIEKMAKKERTTP
jgi:hypothetical protein